MDKNMTESSEKLVRSEIKGRKVTYYLCTEEDLQNVKSSSLLGDIFSVLTSLTAGGIISVILTRATGIQLAQQTTDVLGVLLYVFISTTVIFACFGVYFHSQSFRAIKKIKGSGTVKSLKSGNQEEIVETAMADEEISSGESRLEILKAAYWTSKASIDVTEELRKRIVGNKLEALASNEIKSDPDFGTLKTLTIEYRFDGITVTKVFTEGDRIVIP
jgi:hypothetical protein